MTHEMPVGVRSNTALFDRTQGKLNRSAFTSDVVFEAELERIFGRSWVFVGHESQIPDANDYVQSRIGIDSVIVTRDRQGDVHVLLNSCRHKGMRVVRYDEGNTSVLTCPYHAWSYSTDGNLVDTPGQLVAVQKYKEAYDGSIDKKEWGLVNARVARYKGSIFACWDPDAPSLEEYLGDMRYYWDALLDGRDGTQGGSSAVAGVLKWRINANWKSCTENFIGDGLHGVSHRSVEIAGIGPGGPEAGRQGSGDIRHISGQTDIGFPNYGHGCLGVEPHPLSDDDFDHYPHFLSPSGPLDKPELVDAYYRKAARAQLERRRGEQLPLASILVGGLFPNLAFHAFFPRTIAVWHPVSPTVTEAWRWLIVDAHAPIEVNDLARHYFMRYSGPAGMTEQDDMENWSYLTEASLGTQAKKYDYNYQARMHVQRRSEVLQDAFVTDDTSSEGSIRAYYAAWARHMESESWQDYRRRLHSEPQTDG